jgi:hypothetical protein
MENETLYRLTIYEADSKFAHTDLSQHTPFPRISVGDNIRYYDTTEIVKVTLVEHGVHEKENLPLVFDTIIWTTKIKKE